MADPGAGETAAFSQQKHFIILGRSGLRQFAQELKYGVAIAQCAKRDVTLDEWVAKSGPLARPPRAAAPLGRGARRSVQLHHDVAEEFRIEHHADRHDGATLGHRRQP